MLMSLALKTLVSDRGKLFIGLAGVVFSLVLVNVQGGLYFGLLRKASVLVDHCDAEIWIGHQRVDNVDLAREIPEAWLQRVRGIPQVDHVAPYIVGKGTASLPGGRMEDVWVIGSEPESMLGTAWNFVEGSPADLHRPHGVSFDEVDVEKLGHPRVGTWLEVNGCRTQIVARTRGITGFITMPYLFTTFETARQMSHITPGACSFLLMTLRPGADLPRVLADVRRSVPDAAVYTPGEFAKISQDYWMERTGIGISFGASTAMGLFVGLMMVGQSLYALALDHLDEYATLKALGAEDHHVCGVIALQALTIALVGSVVGLLIVATLRRFWNSPLAPIEIPLPLMAGAVGVVVVICCAAALLPFARIRRIDPAAVLTA